MRLIYAIPLMTPEGNRAHMEHLCRREGAWDRVAVPDVPLGGRD